jgi:maltose alpha-D-glucosyltransferase/alpha-amylase
MIKLLRRIQPGVHPEAEMTRVLRERGFEHVPPLLGEAVRTGPDGEPHTLMIVQGFVYNHGDGWQWTLDMLSRLAAEAGKAGGDFENYGNFAEMLGTRLAQMHDLLALPSDDPAFAPEIMTEAQAQALGVRVCRQLEGFESGQDLLAAVDELALLAIGQQRIRIHGDLHLGQVLVTAGDVMFIDFEGEPARSLAERRAKDLPLRDVAGVLRSFDYAAAAALRELTQADETVDDEVRLLFDRFRDSAVEAFLRGYAGIAGDPRGPLLDLYLIEKAAYEVDYEASNRPDWVDIPRGGLERIAARLLGRGR